MLDFAMAALSGFNMLSSNKNAKNQLSYTADAYAG